MFRTSLKIVVNECGCWCFIGASMMFEGRILRLLK